MSRTIEPCLFLMGLCVYVWLIAPFGCNLAGFKTPLVQATTKVDAPVKVSADVAAELRAEIAALKLSRDSAGGNIWNIGTGGATTAMMLLVYMLSSRWSMTRNIKDAIKGKICSG